MNSNTSNKIYSPRNNDINQDNLNFLNEEASQFLEENEDYETRQEDPVQKRNNSRNYITDNQEDLANRKKASKNFPISKQSNALYNDNENDLSGMNNEEDVNYLRYKNEELHKELIDQLNKINALNEQIKNKEILIQTLKKSVSSLQEKLASADKMKQHLNLQNRQIFETESEVNLIRTEYFKLQEELNNKDQIISEFQKLSEVTKNKFQIFENTNRGLYDEIANLNQLIEDLKFKLNEYSQRDIEKDNVIQELKNSRNSYDKIFEETKYELLKKEEKLRIKFEEKEKELRQKFKEKEENLKEDYIEEIKNLTKKIEEIKNGNDKLKFENIDLRAVIDDYENAKHEREIEFKRINLLRENDFEKLQKKNLEMQQDIEELESKLAEKASDFNSKIRNSEQNEGKFIYQLNAKDKKIKELEDEVDNLKSLVIDLQNVCRENELKADNKQKTIHQLQQKNEDNSQEIKDLENEIGKIQQNNMKELELITIKITELSHEKENLVLENEDLKNALLKATNRIRELNEIIEIKYQGIENQLVKETSAKENLERKMKDLQKKYSINHENLLNEINDLKNVLDKKQIDTDNLVTKYETKIHKLKLKLNEQEYSKDQLLGDMSNMKDWASSLEKKYEPHMNYSSMKNVTPQNESMRGVNYDSKKRMNSLNNITMQEDSHKNMLDNFREIIDKIDDKIQGQYQRTMTNQSYNKNDSSYKNTNAEKPLHTYN